MNSGFFAELREWSEIKHRLLQKYLQPYCYKVGSWSKEIYYVDAFAGPGTYGKDQHRGSPLIAADWARRFEREGRGFRLKCVFVECNRGYYGQLTKHTQELESRGIVYGFHGRFEEKVGTILALIEHYPTFFFIDPFGMSPIKHGTLQPILSRKPSTELLVNFSLKGLQRLAGNLNAKTVTRQATKAAETKVRVLSEVLNTDEWMPIWTSENSRTARERMILHLYESTLREYFEHVFSYPIRTTRKDNPKYYLVFASRSYDAVELMNDFIYDEDEQLGLRTSSKFGMNDLFEPWERGRSFETMKREIRAAGTEIGRTTRRKLRERLIPKRFGLLKRKDYDRAIRELDKEGWIRRPSGRAITDDETLEFATGVQEDH